MSKNAEAEDAMHLAALDAVTYVIAGWRAFCTVYPREPLGDWEVLQWLQANDPEFAKYVPGLFAYRELQQRHLGEQVVEEATQILEDAQ